MPFTPLETIALTFIVIVLIKLIIILIDKNSWLKFTSKIYSKPIPTTIILAAIGILVLYYLVQELSIVHILATFAFTSIIFALGFLQYPKEMHKLSSKMLKKKFSPGIIVYILIWIALIIWTVVTIFS